MVTGTMQTDNAGAAVAVAAGIAVSNAAGQSGRQVATNVNFNPSSAYQDTTSTNARLNLVFPITTTTSYTLYMAGYINISAGTMAYKGSISAVRVA